MTKVRKKNILFIMPNMHCGGSEKVCLTIVNNISRDKFVPKLVLVKKTGMNVSNISKDVEIIDLNSNKVTFAVLKIIRAIWREKPDVVFAGASHLNLLIAIIKPLLPKNIKYIARESSIVSINNKTTKWRYIFNYLYEKILCRFDKIICQSQYMKCDLHENYDISNDKMIVINNPVDIDGVIEKSCEEHKGNISIVAVGRLSKEKGYDLLLQALKYITADIHIAVIGGGPERKNLIDLSVQYEIADKINFLGELSNPYPYMKQAKFLILSSRFEGFPNVVLEAHACGTPVLSFNCPGGISEIIIDGVNGKLVENGNCEALGEVIDYMLNTMWDENKIMATAKNRYDTSIIIPKYEKLFANMVNM